MLPFIIATAVLTATTQTAGGAASSRSFCAQQPGWDLEWSDEFGGAELDRSKWQPVVTPPASAAAAADASGGRRGPLGARGAEGADCAGADCILLGQRCLHLPSPIAPTTASDGWLGASGACRDAACTADSAFVKEGTLVLESTGKVSRASCTGLLCNSPHVLWLCMFVLQLAPSAPQGISRTTGKGGWL